MKEEPGKNALSADPFLTPFAAGASRGGALVWQVDGTDDYVPFAGEFAREHQAQGRKVTYCRFAEHPPLVLSPDAADIVTVSAQAGFEPFLEHMLQIIQRRGSDAAYLFDCISPLAADWYSDQMVGNFLVIVADALRAQRAAACFAILRNHHSHYALDPVMETADAVFDVCRRRQELFVQPLKLPPGAVGARHVMHRWDSGRFWAVPDSHTAAVVLTGSRRDNLGVARHHPGVWSQTFIEAESLAAAFREGRSSQSRMDAMRDRILRMAVSRDRRVLTLVQQYFTLEDLLFLGTRMLGTGLIGGKAADMLLARAALCRHDPRWNDLLEAHDSFFVPSDVFYTYLVQNGCWQLRRILLQTPNRLETAREIRHKILSGAFAPHIMKRFSDMLDYFGESPLVVRSSSLLEDSFGNAFSGKYESVFCANRGDRSRRLDELVLAVKRVYASAMGRDALAYRAAHGLLDRDEQMALLIQRVSGSLHGQYYFPHVAAVGFSFNPYVWQEDIQPRAGVLRMVCGLGTRAVNRVDDDYIRLVALNAPTLRPEAAEADMPAPAQQRLDVLDMEQAQIVSVAFRDVADMLAPEVMRLLAAEDPMLLRAARQHRLPRPFAWRLSFEPLLVRTHFSEDVREMLATLESVYGGPVDIEIAVNFAREGTWRIHVLQCRPLKVKGVEHRALPRLTAARAQMLLETGGPVIGRSRLVPVHAVVYVSPARYSALPEREQFAVARIVGELNLRLAQEERRGELVLIGPGRWGSSMPALGVPVSFSEIRHAGALCEIPAIRDDLVTEVSLGTHFFNDLVELDMLYLAVVPGRVHSFLRRDYFEKRRNLLLSLMPEAVHYESIVRLMRPGAPDSPQAVWLWADTMKQWACLYRDSDAEDAGDEVSRPVSPRPNE